MGERRQEARKGAALGLAILAVLLALGCATPTQSPAPNSVQEYGYRPNCAAVADQVMARCLYEPAMQSVGTSNTPSTGTPEKPGPCRAAAEKAYYTCYMEQALTDAANSQERR